MNLLAFFRCRFGRFALASAMIGAMAGCADEPSQILSRLPESPAVIRTLTPDQQLQRADKIDHEAMREQRQAAHDERMTRYGAFQPLFFGDGM